MAAASAGIAAALRLLNSLARRGAYGLAPDDHVDQLPDPRIDPGTGAVAVRVRAANTRSNTYHR